MAFPATTMLEVLVMVAWNCLSAPVVKNGIFARIFTDQTILSDVCYTASLSFCPGLFEAIQAQNPPAVSFFRNLPSDGSGRFGVYVLVLDKPGTVPKIYIGSGTSIGGVVTRWYTYVRPKPVNTPIHVRKALLDGYEIVHKGLLVWCPIPPAADIPRIRLLFVLIEAAMTFLFWAIHSVSGVHSLSYLSPWPLSSFPYCGLCSHNPLIEAVLGDFDLSAEQLEALAVEAQNRTRLRRNSYSVEYRQNAMASDPERRLGLERKYGAQYRITHPEYNARLQKYAAENQDTVREIKKRSSQKIKASKQYTCTICGVSCSNTWQLKRHENSAKHKIRVQKIESGIELQYRCDICDYSTDVLGSLTRHKASKRHLDKMAKAVSI